MIIFLYLYMNMRLHLSNRKFINISVQHTHLFTILSLSLLDKPQCLLYLEGFQNVSLFHSTAFFHYIMLQELWGHLLIQRIALYNTNTGFRILFSGLSFVFPLYWTFIYIAIQIVK